MKLLSDEEEEAVLDFLTNETLALTELISMPPFNEETVKKPHLCPNCGKILSGLTSYRRHLVSKLNPLFISLFLSVRRNITNYNFYQFRELSQIMLPFFDIF